VQLLIAAVADLTKASSGGHAKRRRTLRLSDDERQVELTFWWQLKRATYIEVLKVLLQSAADLHSTNSHGA